MKKQANASPLLAKMLSSTVAEKIKTVTPAITPTSQLAHGLKLHQIGKLDEAAAVYRTIINLPNHQLTQAQRASALSLLGTIHLQIQQFSEAENLLLQALKLNPNDAISQNNLGVTYKQLNDKEAALLRYQKAVSLDANYPDALNNYGAALLEKQQINEAVTLLNRAIELKPDYADSHYNLGTALQSMLLFDEAEASFQRALSINQKLIPALFNSGLLRLIRGEFEQGWRLYEYRWDDAQAKKYVRNFSEPLWLGDADLHGKTIFLYAEQGLGDFIQFCRYIPLVEKLGAKIIVLVPQELMSLATSLSKEYKFLPRKGTETQIACHFDYQCPILSLPLAFKTTLETIPAQVPYLTTPAEKVNLWHKKLGQKSTTRIGLVWSGASGHLNDMNRSITLKLLAPILRKDVEYHVLQKEIRAHDLDVINELKATHHLHTHCDDLIDFTDTAALVNEMDLIISVDTSVAHLAGALAKTLWLLVPFFPDFRWLLHREDSPWYPTAKLFRQTQSNDWTDVLHQLTLAQDVFLSTIQPEKIWSGTVEPDSNLSSQMLRAQINHALSLHQAGNFTEALDLYSEILKTKPDNTEVLTLVASLYLQQKKLAESQAIFEQSLALDNKNVLTLHNYALLLEKLDRNDEAIAYLDSALALNNTYEDAYKHKANLLKKTRKLDACIETYQTAIQKITHSADLYFRLGNQLRDMKRDQEAFEAMTHATILDNNHAQAHNNLGNILIDLKRPADAVKHYQSALAINPKYANAHNNSANAYLALNQFENAVAACDAALAIDPALLTTLNNRANALQKLQRFDEALQAYDRVIQTHHGYSFAPLNKGLLCLLLGNYSEGWALYEARWAAAPQPKLLEIFSKPLWLGKESIAGKTVLLHAEQGYGDTIQFCRYAALVAAKGVSKLYLNVPKLLFNLISESLSKTPTTSAITVLTDGDTVPQFDFQCPLMSLPLAFNTQVNCIPADIPYLFANHLLVDKWHTRLNNKPAKKPKVGLVWSGSSAYSNDSNRSLALNLLAPLFSLDIEFHSLQKEIKTEDKAAFAALNLQSHQEYLTDFSETAALIHEMDLVISVDTSVAHLAGALGKPVWVLLPFSPDFRWLLNRDDSPWYPTAKLFRQRKTSDWESVVSQLCIKISEHFSLLPVSINIITQITEASDQLDSYNNRANLLKNKGQLTEAIAMYEKAILLEPKNAIAYNNLGSALQGLKQYDKAIESYDQAIALNASYASPKINKAFVLLLLGDFEKGWLLYEWRWKNKQWAPSFKDFTKPLWLGNTDISSKTIFINPEQGLGDYIQFCRYIPLLLNLKANVVAEVPKQLMQLLKSLSNKVMFIMQGDTLPDFDFHCPIFSLPLAFKTTLANIPAKIPYLHASPDKQAMWKSELKDQTLPKIGIVWAGSIGHLNNKNRSIPLNELLALLQLKFEFHILQKDIHVSDQNVLFLLKQFNNKIHIHHNLDDFSDTAALISQLDLVITVDTSVAHLSGALGKPTWVLLPEFPDFRWLLNRDNTPWYPTVKLFRQAKTGSWQDVIKQITAELKMKFK